MRILRTFLLVAFLAGLAALEISHGRLRLETVRAEHRAQALDAFETDMRAAARALVTSRDGGAVPTELLARAAMSARPGPGQVRLAVRGGLLTRDGSVTAFPAPELAEVLAVEGPGFGQRVATATGVWIVLPLGGTPPLWALGARSESELRDVPAAETAWIVLSTVLVIVLLAMASAFFLRLSARAFRLNETERYLRWIRRVTDRYRALMEGAADMILIVEPGSGVVRESNAMAREVLGLSERSGPSYERFGHLRPLAQPAASPGAGARESPRDGAEDELAIDALFEGTHRAALREGLARASDAPGRPVEVPELRARGAGGRELVVDGRLALVDLGDERVVEVSLRDLTLQKEIERQLQIAERLSSMGLLTAGVAHEINNPLEGIGNYLRLLERGDLDEERRQRYLDQVRHGFERIRDIVADLLRFARPTAHDGQADLAQVVERSLAMAAYAKAFREVRTERLGLDAPLPVTGDAGRLEQVVLNLLLNAATAMGGSGRVVIRGARVPAADGGADEVELRVEDEGPGIEAAQLGRLFDPFWSGHGGTGLGLSVSYGIVKAHGGTLTACNREGGGACFTIRLPAGGAGEAARRAAAEALSRAGADVGAGTGTDTGSAAGAAAPAEGAPAEPGR